MLQVIASHPMDLFVSDLLPVVHLGVYSPRRDHYRITIIGSPKKRPAVVFNGMLGTGRFWFFWSPQKPGRAGARPGRYTASLSSSRSTIRREVVPLTR